MTGPVIGHNYFGTNHVENDFQKHPEWENGYIQIESIKTIRDPNTNEVINTCLTHLCYNCMNEDLKNINDENMAETLKITDNPFSHTMLTKERYDKAVIEGIAFSTFGSTNLDNISEPF
jgi:hypothetical protein